MINKIKKWNAFSAASFNAIGGKYAFAVLPVRFGGLHRHVTQDELEAVWLELEEMNAEQINAFQEQLRAATKTIWLTNGIDKSI